jgi:hypothetical protein
MNMKKFFKEFIEDDNDKNNTVWNKILPTLFCIFGIIWFVHNIYYSSLGYKDQV